MKKVTFAGKRPSALPSGNVDEWVQNQETEQPKTKPQEDTKRLTIDIAISLHKRVKSRCAIDNLIMADVIREMLEQRFPPELKQGAGS